MDQQIVLPDEQSEVQPPAQAVETAAPVQAQTTATVPDIEALVEKAVFKAFSGVQSRQDKIAKSVEATVRAQIETLKKAGIEATPAQAAKIAETIREQVITEQMPVSAAVEPKAEQPKPAAATQPTPQAQDINAAAIKIMDSLGMRITNAKEDAEERALLKLDGTPAEYLASIPAAVKAKQERLAKKSAGNPAARVPSGSGQPVKQQPEHANMTAIQTLDLYFNKKFGRS